MNSDTRPEPLLFPSPRARGEGGPAGPDEGRPGIADVARLSQVRPSPPTPLLAARGEGSEASAAPADSEYAELHCLSAFSFGRGASSAEELFERAAKLGYRALAITDECSLAGIVRALEASEKFEVPLIVGSEFALDRDLKCVLLCEDHSGYRRLCELITAARRRSEKGSYRLLRSDFEAGGNNGLLALWLPGSEPDPDAAAWLSGQFPERTWLAIELHHDADDDARLAQLLEFAQRHALPCVAAGDVHMHVRRRRALQDVLTAIRLGTTVAEAGRALFPNGERHLRTRRALSAIYPPQLLAESTRIAGRCRFNLHQLKYRYPEELVPQGHTPTSWLRELTERGCRERWPGGTPDKVRAQIDEELRIIANLEYEAFFLTVEDIVQFANGKGILCQGRGSSANSAVCYALGITSVDPDKQRLLFGRFLSEERKEPPDIDVDFEHDRREEVIQYVYGKYGRERAALAATVIRWEMRSAAREVAKALGLTRDQQDALSGVFRWAHGDARIETRLQEQGFDPQSPVLLLLCRLIDELSGLPRHLSQHVGGFVIAGQPLSTLVPVENAAMADRTVIQWDKDDLELLGLLKVDVLALGMLSCLRRGFELLQRHGRERRTLATIPIEDKATYDMLCRADTIGVFQVESRAQMSMLPRLRPRRFYDLVIQVAIVRPGPIQGGMVHPYLQRRQDPDAVEYPSEALKPVLERTLGVPIFQEQVIELAMVAADFTAGEADRLRRSMAAWKRRGGLEPWRDRLLQGMAKNGYPAEFAERIFEQIKGFGDYGFPESHAASFALLAYASAWLKCHEPGIFTAALLNSLPMGFYAPAQLIGDARRHGVIVRPVDVLASDYDCTLEPEASSEKGLALRLGLRLAKGLSEDTLRHLVDARGERPFADVGDLARRARLDRGALEKLAAAGALKRLAGHRHRALWAVAGTETSRVRRRAPDDAAAAQECRPTQALAASRTGSLALEFGDSSHRETRVALRPPSLADDIHADYASVGLSLRRHPLSLVRARLQRKGVLRAADLGTRGDGDPVRVAGLVTLRQRPQTASGITFVTIEDETGLINLVVRKQVAERDRRALLESRLLAVRGHVQEAHGIRHVIAHRLANANALLPALDVDSRDFH